MELGTDANDTNPPSMAVVSFCDFLSQNCWLCEKVSNV